MRAAVPTYLLVPLLCVQMFSQRLFVYFFFPPLFPSVYSTAKIWTAEEGLKYDLRGHLKEIFTLRYDIWLNLSVSVL